MTDPITDLFPPFQPDPDEPKKRRFQPIPLRVLIPNLITLLALCLGLTAIRLAIEGGSRRRCMPSCSPLCLTASTATSPAS